MTNADCDELLTLVSELANAGPLVGIGSSHVECRFCQALDPYTEKGVRHERWCWWARARQFLDKIDRNEKARELPPGPVSEDEYNILQMFSRKAGQVNCPDCAAAVVAVEPVTVAGLSVYLLKPCGHHLERGVCQRWLSGKPTLLFDQTPCPQCGKMSDRTFETRKDPFGVPIYKVKSCGCEFNQPDLLYWLVRTA